MIPILAGISQVFLFAHTHILQPFVLKGFDCMLSSQEVMQIIPLLPYTRYGATLIILYRNLERTILDHK